MIDQKEPQRAELLLVQCLVTAVFIGTFSHFGHYLLAVERSGDNTNYIAIAKSIRHWNFAGVTPKLFWGTSYATAVFSGLFRTPERISLLLLSMICCLGALWLARDLWGGWVAAFFMALNFDWIQRSFLGGSEPLFVLLIFASLLFARKESWKTASLLASLATVVRPIGFLLLLALGMVLLVRREYKTLAASMAVSIAIGCLYVLPLWLYFGDPLATYHGYHGDWNSRSPLGFPFRALWMGALEPHRPLTNLILNSGWIVFAAVGFAMLCAHAKNVPRERRVEWLFAILYLLFLFTYNSTYWAFAEFPRFLIPIIPMVLAGLWLPRKRLIWIPLALASAVLAALSAIGIHNVLPI